MKPGRKYHMPYMETYGQGQMVMAAIYFVFGVMVCISGVTKDGPVAGPLWGDQFQPWAWLINGPLRAEAWGAILAFSSAMVIAGIITNGRSAWSAVSCFVGALGLCFVALTWGIPSVWSTSRAIFIDPATQDDPLLTACMIVLGAGATVQLVMGYRDIKEALRHAPTGDR